MSIATEIERLQNAKASIKTSIENKGVEVGDGTLDTYASKIDEISGDDSHYDMFWDNYQDYGNRTSYSGAFRNSGWNDETFAPKYDIISQAPNSWSNESNQFSNCKITDFDAILKKQGVKLILKNCVDFIFYGSSVTNVVLDLGQINAYSSNLFNGCSKLVSAELQNATKKLFQWNSFFGGCPLLQNIKLVNCLIQAEVNVSGNTLLTHESLMNIINSLADLTESGTSIRCILGADNIAKLTADEIAIATNKGWVVS